MSKWATSRVAKLVSVSFGSAENFYSKYEQQNLLAKIFVPLWSKLFSKSKEVGFSVQQIKKKCVA